MTDSEALRRVALALPRAYEVQVRGHWKFRVGQIVFVAFSVDEQEMGFGFPRAEREALVALAPEKFFLPTKGDLRYQWVCARLPALDDDEMRELVVEAWRMCVPKMLHELPELPEPTARVWDLVDHRSGRRCARCCIPTCTSGIARPSCAAGPRPCVTSPIIRHRSRRPRWRCATGSSTAGSVDDLVLMTGGHDH